MIRDIQIGRLFIRLHRTRGPGFRISVQIRRDQPGFHVWVGRQTLDVCWLHRANCECWDCEETREMNRFDQADKKS